MGESEDGDAGRGVEPAPHTPTDVLLSLDHTAARALVDLLELLAALPSTPDLLGSVSRLRAEEIGADLPGGPGGPAPTAPTSRVVEVHATCLVAVAGLLQRLGELPSTPPVVADDARAWAAELWARLEAGDM